ncbi:MAG: tetratricopeptide repeat protein [Verrucomicrobiota bacterium]|nr:tetratricopeptide repeat protein [Verrucomicrobiota bacterium]
MSDSTVQNLVEEATLDFTLGDNDTALAKLDEALALDPACFDAWHTRTEVLFAANRLDDALAAAEKALSLRPDDIHIHTSLSRIWMEKGNKPVAEDYGAKARLLGWKSQLKQ